MKPINLLTICIIFLGFTSPVRAQALLHPLPDEMGGTVQAEIDDRVIDFPTLKTDITADIEGDLATVTVTQIFANPLNMPLNAQYLFPLNKDGAVYAMTMEVGDEIIKAQIKEKEDARETFEAAKKEGKTASLLVQHRSNIFTQNLANLMPGLPIKVTLKYTQAVPKIDGEYELVIPLIVGPRYQPADTGAPKVIDEGASYGTQESRANTAFGRWEIENLPDYPHVAGLSLPKTIEEDRVSIDINMNADMPIRSLKSDTHELAITGDKTSRHVRLAQGRVIDNRDFVLHYSLEGKRTQAGFLATHKDGQGYFSLLIEPPEVARDTDITPREMVFVLDTSGSMNGAPLKASKTFMRHALQNLRPSDYFRIIQFNNNAAEFTTAPIPADTANLMKGLSYVNSLYASGGTEMRTAIDQAFSAPPAEGTLRIVVFLTDGYIGNEATILSRISEKLTGARIYALGVGTSVNRYLLAEMGRVGRGFARFIDPIENMEEAAVSLAKRLETPILTDIEINWGDLDVKDVTPDLVPDLFAGDSIRIQGRFTGQGAHEIRVNGKVKGRRASMPLQITLPPAHEKEKEAIPLIWARSQIAEAMRHVNVPFRMRENGLSDDFLKQKVVELGLDFSLMTQWTSFVAVTQKAANATPDVTQDRHVPLPMVKGVTAQAYPQTFSGGSTPEPGMMGGLAVLGGAAYAALRRRKKGSFPSHASKINE